MFSQADENYMRQALALAADAAHVGEVPVGAVVVFEGEVIAQSHNAPIAKHDPSAHAEILALRLAGERLKNYRLPEASLYVTLEPCLMCMVAMVHARVKECVYAARDPKTGALDSQCHMTDFAFLNHQFTVRSGLFAEESKQLLQDFFRQRRK